MSPAASLGQHAPVRSVVQGTPREPRPAIYPTVAFLLAIFLVWLLDHLLSLELKQMGILPRTAEGLAGIAFSPLLHKDWRHVLSNIASLFLLLLFLFGNARYRPKSTLALIWILGGLGTWLIGRASYHIGASTLVFGLVPYLVLASIWMRCWYAGFIALVVLFLHFGIFFALFQIKPGVSWEGHLSGFVSGIMAAYILHKR